MKFLRDRWPLVAGVLLGLAAIACALLLVALVGEVRP